MGFAAMLGSGRGKCLFIAICAKPHGSLSLGCSLGWEVGETLSYHFTSKQVSNTVSEGGHITASYTLQCTLYV